MLDEEEFGIDPETITCEEILSRSAIELGLMVGSGTLKLKDQNVTGVKCSNILLMFCSRRRIRKLVCYFFSYHQLCL